MPVDDISQAETRKVGNALASVRLDQMLVSLAKGIAWGQYDLEKVGMEIAKTMGVPGTLDIGDERTSMLEAGFLPTFYQFIDTIMELKMEVKVREEQVRSLQTKGTSSSANAAEWAGQGAQTRTSAAYSRSVDAAYSQKYGQELSASSLMRTKLVPKPPPERLIERIRILLDQLRKQAADEAREEGIEDQDERTGELLRELVEEHMLGSISALVSTSPR